MKISFSEKKTKAKLKSHFLKKTKAKTEKVTPRTKFSYFLILHLVFKFHKNRSKNKLIENTPFKLLTFTKKI